MLAMTEIRRAWLKNRVEAPDPENFWVFEPGETKILAEDPLFSLKLVRIRNQRAVEMEENWKGAIVSGLLFLDQPECLLQDQQGVPLVAATLRDVRDDKAYLQLTELAAK